MRATGHHATKCVVCGDRKRGAHQDDEAMMETRERWILACSFRSRAPSSAAPPPPRAPSYPIWNTLPTENFAPCPVRRGQSPPGVEGPASAAATHHERPQVRSSSRPDRQPTSAPRGSIHPCGTVLPLSWIFRNRASSSVACNGQQRGVSGTQRISRTQRTGDQLLAARLHGRDVGGSRSEHAPLHPCMHACPWTSMHDHTT